MTVVRIARIAAASFFLGHGQLGGEAAKVVRELGASSQRAWTTAPDRLDPLQYVGGLSCGDLFADAAGDDLAEHGAETAGNPGSPPGPESRWRLDGGLAVPY